MQKPQNESLSIAAQFGNQHRYISTRRIRKLRARWRRHATLAIVPQYRHITGKLWSWLRPLPKE